VIVGVPQASVAVAVPSAPLTAADEGLHPRGVLLPVAVIVGAVTSTVHVAVLAAVEVLLQTSVAVQVLVCERLHPLLCILPSVVVIVGVPQASVAVADPSAASMLAVCGLHPTAKFAPVAVIMGGELSFDHVTVRDVVAVLPQTSVAVHVLVCEVLHPEVV
jgi:hypothetical protein